MMNEQLEKTFQKNPYYEKVYFILEECQKAGHQTVLVGGAVRDALLGQTPKDFDIASSATPDELLKLFPYAHAVGKSFGVVWIPFQEGAGVEIATFRKDGVYKDGRHPSSVEFCTLEQDVLRRDFTVNALYYDIKTQKVIDEVGGVEDLKNKLIQTVGEPDRRFEEDHLRVLRAIRFAVTFDFKIEENTLSSLKKWLLKLDKISKERILDELNKTFVHGKFKSTIDYFSQIQFLEVLFSGSGLKGYNHDFWNIPDASDHPLGFWWSLLLAPVGLSSAKDLKLLLKDSLLRFSNQQYKDVSDFFSFFSQMTQKSVRVGQKLRCLNHPHASWYLKLSKHLVSFQDSSEKFLNEWVELEKKYQSILQDGKLPQKWVTGDDLIQQGLSEGPQFSKLLEEFYNDQLEGRVSSKEELLKKIKN